MSRNVVNDTPSPEARYPVAINEAYAATKWVAEHGDQIQVDGKRLAVAGNSVGGNMAALRHVGLRRAVPDRLKDNLRLAKETLK